MANKLVDEAGLAQAMTEVNDTFIKNTDTLFTFEGSAVKKGGAIGIPSFYEVRSTLPDDAGANYGKILLIPADNTGTDNTYIEYIAVDKRPNPSAPHNYQWEKLGEHKAGINLAEYTKISDFNTLKGRVDGHDTKLAEHTTSISTLQSTVSGHTTTIGQHTTKLQQLDYTILSEAAVTAMCDTVFGS